MPLFDVFQKALSEGAAALVGPIFGELSVLFQGFFVNVDFPAHAASVGTFVGDALELVVKNG